MKSHKLILTIALAGAAMLLSTSTLAKDRSKVRGAPDFAVIYVTSQDAFYDSILLGSLFGNLNT